MSTMHSLVALANTCATASATTLPSTCALVYTAAKPRGPVRRNTIDSEVATPTLKRSFVMPKFLGLMRLNVSAQWLRGVVGATRKDARTAESVFLTTMLHLLRVETQTVVPLTHSGAKTMTHVTQGRTAPVLATSATHPNQLFADAVNAASMATWYTRRGNIAAAARKARQHLAALNQLAKLEGGAA